MDFMWIFNVRIALFNEVQSLRGGDDSDGENLTQQFYFFIIIKPREEIELDDFMYFSKPKIQSNT